LPPLEEPPRTHIALISLAIMSGFGESIAVELISQIVVKTAILGIHVVRNAGQYAQEAQQYRLRLQVQVGIIQAINQILEDPQIKHRVRPADLATFGSVMKEIHGLFKKYIERHCRNGPEKLELLKQASAEDLFVQLEAKEVMKKMSEQEKKSNSSFWLRMRDEAFWAVWKKTRNEQLVSEIEFWGGKLDRFVSWVVPGMFPHATSAEISTHVGDSRLVETTIKSRIMLARRASDNTSFSSVNSTSTVRSNTTGPDDASLHLMDIDDPADIIPAPLNSGRIEFIDKGFVRSPSPLPARPSCEIGWDLLRRSDLGGPDRRQWAEYIDDNGNRIPVIVEFKSRPTHDDFRYGSPQTVTDEINKLIKTLRIAGQRPQTFRVMPCEGWFETYDYYGLVYRLPQHPLKFRCESLGNILLKPEYKNQLQKDLDNRLKLAKALAWTMFELHTVDWVHQSFHPDNILLFGEELPSGTVMFDWSSPYVVGFDSSRSNSGISGKLNFRGEWLSRLYTHPQRLLKDYERYKKIHDIYSLGVVLLEVGRLGSFMEDKQYAEWHKYGPEKLRDVFKEKAKALQTVVGKNYRQVVTACLDGDFDDQEDYSLLSEFRSKVCDKLEQIKISS
jgi:hypothetical protein